MGEKKKTKQRDKIPFYKSIKAKLVVGFGVPIALLIVLGVVSYQQASQAILAIYEKSMINTIEKVSDYYDLLIKNILNESNKLTQNSVLNSYFKGAYSEDELEEFNYLQRMTRDIMLSARMDTSIKEIHVYGAGGIIEVSSTKNNLLPYKEYLNTTEGKEMGDKKGYPVLSGYHPVIDEACKIQSETYAFTVRRNVTNQSLQPVGCVILDISTEAIAEPLMNVEMEEGSLCAFVTPDGREITKDGQGENIFLNLPVYLDFLAGEEKIISSNLRYQGEMYRYIFSEIGDTGFTVCTIIPEKNILAQVSIIKKVTIPIVVVAIILSAFIAAVLSIGINNSVKSLSKPLRAAARGDLTVTSNVKAKDEFRILSNHVAFMLENTKDFIGKSYDISGHVLDSAVYMADSTGEVVVSAEYIRGIVNNVEKGVSRQTKDVENCLEKMDDLSGKIEIVYEDTGNAGKYAEKTNKILEKGINTVKTLNEKTTQTSEITNTVIAEIGDLITEMKRINSIVDTINEIASQTNLLSLNASIEAARAGEAGRGFHIVASEIRKLADESVNSVNKIRDIIEGIGEKTNQTISISRQAKTMVDTQGEALQDTIGSFDEISQGVRGLTDQILQITGTMKTMEGTKNETREAISSIAVVSQETSVAAEEVKAAAAKQLDSIQNLNNAANKLNVESEKLKDAISAFRIC